MVNEASVATVTEASAPRVIEFTVTFVLITAGLAESITTLAVASGTIPPHQLLALFHSEFITPVQVQESSVQQFITVTQPAAALLPSEVKTKVNAPEG